jgi:hypothetical protein
MMGMIFVGSANALLLRDPRSSSDADASKCEIVLPPRRQTAILTPNCSSDRPTLCQVRDDVHACRFVGFLARNFPFTTTAQQYSSLYGESVDS